MSLCKVVTKDTFINPEVLYKLDKMPEILEERIARARGNARKTFTDLLTLETTWDDRSVAVGKGLSDALDIIDEFYGKTIDEKFLYTLNRSVRQHVEPNLPFSWTRPYRTDDVQIEGLKSPPHAPEIDGLMNRILYSISEHSDLDTLHKVAIAYGGIYFVQPFNDGNKRTGRLTGDKILEEQGLRTVSYDDREEYITALETVYKNIRLAYKTGEDICEKSLYQPLIKKLEEANPDLN